MIFPLFKAAEFDVYKIQRHLNCLQNESDAVSRNYMRIGINFRYAQKFRSIRVLGEINTYVLYVFNYLLSFLYSILSKAGSELEVSLR